MIFDFSRRDYEEEYDYYRGPKKPVHERLTWKRRPQQQQENQYDSNEDFEEDTDHRLAPASGKSRNKKDYHNFKVTVRNEDEYEDDLSEGTPSLSGVDDDTDTDEDSEDSSDSSETSGSDSSSDSSVPTRKRQARSPGTPPRRKNSSKRRFTPPPPPPPVSKKYR